MTKEQYILDLINQGYKDEDIAILVANKFPDELPLAAPAPTTNRTPQDVLDRLVAVIERVNNIHANNWTDTEFKNKALNVGIATEEYVDSENAILHSAITSEQKIITDAIKTDVVIAKDIADKAIVKPTNLIAGKQYGLKYDGTFSEIVDSQYIEIRNTVPVTDEYVGKNLIISFESGGLVAKGRILRGNNSLIMDGSLYNVLNNNGLLDAMFQNSYLICEGYLPFDENGLLNITDILDESAKLPESHIYRPIDLISMNIGRVITLTADDGTTVDIKVG